MTFLKTSDGEFVPLSEIIAAWEMTPTFVELVRNGIRETVRGVL